MKNKLIKPVVLSLCLLMLSGIFLGKLSAQTACGYQIQNHWGCPVTLEYHYTDLANNNASATFFVTIPGSGGSSPMLNCPPSGPPQILYMRFYALDGQVVW